VNRLTGGQVGSIGFCHALSRKLLPPPPVWRSEPRKLHHFSLHLLLDIEHLWPWLSDWRGVVPARVLPRVNALINWRVRVNYHLAKLSVNRGTKQNILCDMGFSYQLN
jgi:hypothetical protein